MKDIPNQKSQGKNGGPTVRSFYISCNFSLKIGQRVMYSTDIRCRL